jgi:hypothetical protein
LFFTIRSEVSEVVVEIREAVRRHYSPARLLFCLATILLAAGLVACTPPTKTESAAVRHATREAVRADRGNTASTPNPERVATRQAARVTPTPNPEATHTGNGPAKEATRLVEQLKLTPDANVTPVSTPVPIVYSNGSPKQTRGVFAITQHNEPFQTATLSDPWVDGVVIRTFWSDVEPSLGVYNWTFIDSQVSAATDRGKRIVLIVLPGAFTPQWALQGVQVSQFDSKYGFTKGQPLNLPVPWDQAYLDRWYEFVKTLGQRYDSNPAVVLIPVAGPTSVSAEMSLPNGPDAIQQWTSLGYSTDKFETAWTSALAAYSQAFPTTQLGLTLYPGLPIPDLTASDKTRQDLAGLAVGLYGSKMAVQTSGLSARKEDHPRLGFELVQQYAARTTVGFEMGTSATEKPDRMGGSDPVTALRQSIDYGLSAGANYLVIYEKDIDNPDLQDTLRYAHTALTH